ncbi:MAG: crossover junction endodeoxyribonuclease RuvC [Patescibacteria group bacterium]
MSTLKKSTRILGIDPGTALIGYGIIDADGKNYRVVAYGDFRTAANQLNKDRVWLINNFFDELIKKHRPDKIALESVFFFKNQKTVIGVSEVRGVLLLAAARHGLAVAEFTPLQVKQAVSGYGRAEKEQVQKMVKLILALERVPEPNDTADALALAICCANTIVY